MDPHSFPSLFSSGQTPREMNLNMTSSPRGGGGREPNGSKCNNVLPTTFFKTFAFLDTFFFHVAGYGKAVFSILAQKSLRLNYRPHVEKSWQTSYSKLNETQDLVQIMVMLQAVCKLL